MKITVAQPTTGFVVLSSPSPLRTRSEREKKAVARALKVNAELRESLRRGR